MWCLIVVLFCISLMSNDIDHLFMCLSAIRISFWSNADSDPLSTFNWVVFLLLSCKSSLYILLTSSLSDKLFANIFSHSVVFLFTFFMVTMEIKSFNS